MDTLQDVRIKNMFVPDHLLQSDNFVDSIGKNVNTDYFNALQHDLNNVLDYNPDLLVQPDPEHSNLDIVSKPKPIIVPNPMYVQIPKHYTKNKLGGKHKHTNKNTNKQNVIKKKVGSKKPIVQTTRLDEQTDNLTDFDVQIIKLLITHFELKHN